jgi:hypothetical protein
MAARSSILATLALASTVCVPFVRGQGNGGSVSGHVTNTLTGGGIDGATVYVCIPTVPSPNCGPEVEHTLKKAVTDDKGAFRISEIPEGQYTMFPPSKEGFFPNLGLSPVVRVFGDTRVDLQMTPFATVHGRVLDPEGKPAPGIAVKLGPVSEDRTDEKGEFAFEDVPPGMAFALSATPPTQPDSNPNDGERLVTTYYPSVVDRDQAVQIKVEGVDLFGYDIRLRTAAARAISGIVIDADGKPVAHARVTVSRRFSGMLTTVRGPMNFLDLPQTTAAEPVETKDDGTFAFPPVLEGNWNVRASARLEDTTSLSGAVAVSVSRSDIQNLEVRLARPFEVEVTADWGEPAPATTPAIRSEVDPLDNGQGARPSPPVPGQPQKLYLFAGRFFIGPGFSLTPGYYAAAAMLDNRDVLGQVVELAGPTSLKIIYKSGGGSVRGTVAKGGRAVVVLMAPDTPVARLGFSTQCEADGTFSIRDVPPGSYTAVAIPDFGLITTPNFPTMLAASGRRVQVEAGATAPVDLELARQQ